MAKKRFRDALERYRRELQRNLLARPGVHEFVLVLDGLKAGYNVAKILRSAEVFGVRRVYLVDIGPFDPAPAKGALRKVPLRLCASFAEAHAELSDEGYAFFLLGPDAESPLHAAEIPTRSAFILGHEEFGPRLDGRDWPGIQSLCIPQYGQTQSLNVSVAAGIVMYEYCRRYGRT
ncbi:tRNA (guanosine-2'-O-)-methyltransferase [Geothermobacter ehrlichii]|uniref:tRNA (Guanosine-2'-O-)-methyltransferase n=1 Tax=Geothermobacter ehrlichii TaxID=213224 RepID=A0A5D3WM34_9BACT|nr:TrmH family RNA methyltransferase [Geothermobacter ehrlichii]TYO99263.1 tRNA (guanosine-2'-O-)-methyltransferase [Geothermobacter ehrlichii]